jgi:hypothetical protein
MRSAFSVSVRAEPVNRNAYETPLNFYNPERQAVKR